MTRTVRKWTALLLALALSFALIPPRAQAAETGSEVGLSLFSKDKTLHILAVGNSFSVDGLQYLYQMADSAGYDVVIGNLYKSSCDLKTHWNNLEAGEKAYTYYKISEENGGAWGKKSDYSITDALEDEQWDVITLQQASGLSGVPESYYRTTWTCTTSGTTTTDKSRAVSFSGQQAAGSDVEPEPETSAVSQEKGKAPITCNVAESGEGATFSLNAAAPTDLSYESSNTKVAQVDDEGTVTLTGSGTATVTITAAESEEYEASTAKVRVSSQRTTYMELLTDKMQSKYRKKWGTISAQKLKFGWQVTWAYAKDGISSNSFRSNYETYYHSDQDTMYQAIMDTAQKVVVDSDLFSFYVPSGTAIQNARSSYAGDRLNRDGVHLSYGLGRYIAAMTWAATLGIDVNEISYRPTGTYAVSPLDLNMVRASVTDALQNPWSAPPSSETEQPSLKATTLKEVANTSSGLRLTWSKVSNATGYRIYRKKGSGSYSLIETITSGSTTKYTDTEVKSKSGTTYTYCVKAYSGELITASSSNKIQQTRLTAPGKVTASNTSSGIKITWNKVTGATSYRVYRTGSDGERTCLKTLSDSTVSYTDTAVKSKNGVSYTYDVVACTKLGEGVPSDEKTLVRLNAVTVKSLRKSGSALKLTWSRNSKAAGYYIYRKTGSGSWSKVKTISKNSTLTYTDKTVKKGKTYSYRVYAYKGDSTSAVSNTKTLKR